MGLKVVLSYVALRHNRPLLFLVVDSWCFSQPWRYPVSLFDVVAAVSCGRPYFYENLPIIVTARLIDVSGCALFADCY